MCLNTSFCNMFIAWKQEMVLEAKTHALNAPRYRFLHGTTQNMSFRLKSWIGHVRCDRTRNGFEGINSCIWCTRYWFSQWVRCGNEMTWNHLKHEFRCKVCSAKPHGCFRAPKWCANSQNVSFLPKGVHWNLSSSMSRVLQFRNIQSNARRY